MQVRGAPEPSQSTTTRKLTQRPAHAEQTTLQGEDPRDGPGSAPHERIDIREQNPPREVK